MGDPTEPTAKELTKAIAELLIRQRVCFIWFLNTWSGVSHIWSGEEFDTKSGTPVVLPKLREMRLVKFAWTKPDGDHESVDVPLGEIPLDSTQDEVVVGLWTALLKIDNIAAKLRSCGGVR
jgi:hypothetical protein